ncbi:SDR family oxidoreductase [Bosea sp. (in: a-proteobacteria)]|jgi:NAD(P)-dependent dehydrogenase (short-subunit alcohol dehydrogenase family)|uniref:SDR family NAD(P)-dependent oxidoreductase n=1 Tax=Bosea sp. (in: a-proteobacteria) TaxID=1871050 RepID=UPI002734BDA0|nr:SDR family NAD(P)-dependent oxidoreductase [Bosea sp. (in: a-proteobacteria)]MDP3410423.1 SDR family NAD(P)-dependent oxidoreductase [Bosea sp. (in: a-proteobacteria)]
MSLPRMQPGDGVAWVTGASSGIGEAVALELARRGWTVAITARRLDLLENVARRAEGLPGRIVAHAGDVTDSASMKAVIDGIESVQGPIALAFLNAGIAPDSGGVLDIAAFERIIAVNLLGAARGLSAVMERMALRGRGQIAVNASVAGYGGLPGASAYGVSKAAAIHLCETLKFTCDQRGIRLQLVNPGWVETPLTRTKDVPMPFIMPPDEAARRIVDGFARGGFEITFPRRLSWLLKAINLLPYPAYFWLLGMAARRGAARPL